MVSLYLFSQISKKERNFRSYLSFFLCCYNVSGFLLALMRLHDFSCLFLNILRIIGKFEIVQDGYSMRMVRLGGSGLGSFFDHKSKISEVTRFEGRSQHTIVAFISTQVYLIDSFGLENLIKSSVAFPDASGEFIYLYYFFSLKGFQNLRNRFGFRHCFAPSDLSEPNTFRFVILDWVDYEVIVPLTDEFDDIWKNVGVSFDKETWLYVNHQKGFFAWGYGDVHWRKILENNFSQSIYFL